MDGRPILDVLRHLGDIADPELRQKVRNVGGGLYNHEFFWNCLTAAALAESFGSVAAFKDAFSAAAGKVFGSGWAWLVADADRKPHGRHHPQPGPARARARPPDEHRRLGARLLHPAPEPPARLHQVLLGRSPTGASSPDNFAKLLA
eukprot:gnl/Ergobibamus_cyprinoides/5423.p3 GENE.gnl/Ergobibamus_cyprinoides/5423~~gnl/Ergobibamus_cyprinoides/5423.p3  ORF type:complete len:147 (+),score=43.74 gnl/Ergobibamus_cyprinoides/5423:139-579(+)